MARIDSTNEAYRAHMAAVLKQHYFTTSPPQYFETEIGRDHLADHVSRRYQQAMDHVVPWLRRKFDLSGMTVLEVGSGTGSSTLAFCQVARSVDCYEIYRPSAFVARERLDFWGIGNVRIHSALFDDACPFVQSGGRADAILLYATLEHMTHEEALAILALAWRVLRPKGILIVADTPNRFNPVDEHTSWLPLFSQLPRALQILYAPKSPREDFRRAIARASDVSEAEGLMTMTRWGSGVSYHEFELALGDAVHQSVALDGYEPEITSMIPVSSNDTLLQTLFEQCQIKAHRAFTRRSFYFVLQRSG